MQPLTTATNQVRQAHDLPAVLDAACGAFEAILAAIAAVEDASDHLLVTLLLAGTQAANGRDAVLFAPALPPHPLHQTEPAEERPQPASPPGITAAVAELSQLLATRLSHAAATLAAGADRGACQDAAARAHRIHALLAGGGP